jgi:hypothetical protein
MIRFKFKIGDVIIDQLVAPLGSLEIIDVQRHKNLGGSLRYFYVYIWLGDGSLEEAPTRYIDKFYVKLTQKKWIDLKRKYKVIIQEIKE